MSLLCFFAAVETLLMVECVCTYTYRSPIGKAKEEEEEEEELTGKFSSLHFAVLTILII